MAGLVSVRFFMPCRNSSRPVLAADAPPARPSEDGIALRIGAGLATRLGLAALAAGAGAATGSFGRPFRAAPLGAGALGAGAFAAALRAGPLGAVALRGGAFLAAFFAGFFA